MLTSLKLDSLESVRESIQECRENAPNEQAYTRIDPSFIAKYYVPEYRERYKNHFSFNLGRCQGSYYKIESEREGAIAWVRENAPEAVYDESVIPRINKL